jgi:hypothetical protein
MQLANVSGGETILSGGDPSTATDASKMGGAARQGSYVAFTKSHCPRLSCRTPGATSRRNHLSGSNRMTPPDCSRCGRPIGPASADTRQA